MEKVENNNNQAQHRFLTIGQVAEAVSYLSGQRCTSAMIHNYEKQKLLETPERSAGGFRLYSLIDVHRIAQIKRLQDEGLSLAEIRLHPDLTHVPDNLAQLQWPEKPLDRRVQIQEVARRIFPKKGFTDTTLQDIALEAGISGPAIYQYFSSKEELFLSLFEEHMLQGIFEELTAELQIKEDATYEEVRAVLVDLGESFLDFHKAQAESIRMFISETRRYPEIGRSFLRNLGEPIEADLAEYLDYFVARGLLEIADTSLAAHALFGMLFNINLTQSLFMGDRYDGQPFWQLSAQLVDLFLNGARKKV